MAIIRKTKSSRFFIAQFRNAQKKLKSRSTRIPHSEGTPEERAEARSRAKMLAEDWERLARGRNTTEAALRKTLVESYEAATQKKFYEPSIAEFFGYFLKDFAISVENGENAPATLTRYDGVVRKFLAFLGERRCQEPFDSLTPEDFKSFRNYRLKKVCAKTVQNDLKALNIPLEEAYHLERLTRNPLKSFNLSSRRLKRRSVSGPPRLPFELKEIRQQLNYCRNSDFSTVGGGKAWEAIICLGLYTGLRLADICELTWAEIDLHHKLIRLSPHKTLAYGTKVEVPIHPRLEEALLRMPSSDRHFVKLFPAQQPTTEKQKMDRDYSKVSKQFIRLLEAAGVDPMPIKRGKIKRIFNRKTFHSLRHTIVTCLRKANVSKEIRMKIVGHINDDVHNVYDHVDLEDSKAAIHSMPSL